MDEVEVDGSKTGGSTMSARRTSTIDSFVSSIATRGFMKTQLGRIWVWATVIAIVLNTVAPAGLIAVASAQSTPTPQTAPATPTKAPNNAAPAAATATPTKAPATATTAPATATTVPPTVTKVPPTATTAPSTATTAPAAATTA